MPLVHLTGCIISVHWIPSGDFGIQWLTRVIKQVWQTGIIPPDWKKGIIIPIYKGNGSPKDCRKYGGITLLSVPRKVFATVLLSKICDQLLAHCRKEQSGFTHGRSAIGRIVTLKTVIQSRKELQRIAFIDLKAAFDNTEKHNNWTLGVRPRCRPLAPKRNFGGTPLSTEWFSYLPTMLGLPSVRFPLWRNQPVNLFWLWDRYI